MSPAPGKTKWDRVQEMDEFRLLILAKKEFVIPATVFFVVYYFLLPVLVGYAPELMSRKVWGAVNWAYLFALSQFFMAWGIAFPLRERRQELRQIRCAHPGDPQKRGI